MDSRPLTTDEAKRVRDAALTGMGKHGGHVARRSVRRDYALTDELVLTVATGGGTAQHYLVRPRNISTCGMGFLHSAALPPGTACHITLLTSQGSAMTVEAEVIRCCALSAASHVVGIRFVRAIEIEAVLGPRKPPPHA